MGSTAAVVLDKRKVNDSGTYYVKVRVTHDRKSKYYPCQHKKDAQDGKSIPDTLQLNRSFTEAEFDRIMSATRRSDSEKLYKQAFDLFRLRAETVINKLPVFSFESFERAYIKNAGAGGGVKATYDQKIAELKKEGRIGNAVAYQCAINSLEKYKKGLKFADITPDFLRSYDQTMRDSGKTGTTIGFYMRTLRTVFNELIYGGDLEKDTYPFKSGKSDTKKYSPPTGKNVKKALKPEHLSKLYYYTSNDRVLQQARDFWVFSYLANGMNIKDILNLKKTNIDGEYIRYERAKTAKTKAAPDVITVHLKGELQNIIKKYHKATLDPNAFIFPILDNKMSEEVKYKKVQFFVRAMNKGLERICEEIEIPRISTYSSRHSFAHILKVNSAPIELIREAMGHSSISVTKNYLGSFEDNVIKEATEVLIPKQNIG